jgi:hypothetical protein
MRIEADFESHGIYAFDGTGSGARFLDPTDVDIDDEGFIYVVDRSAARVVRYEDLGSDASYVQDVNLGTVMGEPLLQIPERAAVHDTIIYVSDPPTAAARRYERRRK